MPGRPAGRSRTRELTISTPGRMPSIELSAAPRGARSRTRRARLRTYSLARYFPVATGGLPSQRRKEPQAQPPQRAMSWRCWGFSSDTQVTGTGCRTHQRSDGAQPPHPGWYRFSPFFERLPQGDGSPRHSKSRRRSTCRSTAATRWRGLLAQRPARQPAAAEAAARELLRVWPSFEKEYERVGLDPWVYALAGARGSHSRRPRQSRSGGTGG